MCKCHLESLLEIQKLGKEDRSALPATFARLSSLARDLQFDLQIPQTWMREIAKQFDKSKQPLSVDQLRELGRGGLNAGHPDLAYVVSARGLETGEATHAEFLMMRAKALPQKQFERRMVCAAAAAELARQRGDVDLAGKAVELLSGPFADGSLKVTPEQAAEVVRLEKTKRKPNAPPPSYRSITAGDFCDCPDCQRARGEPPDPFDLHDEDDFDEDDPFENLEIPGDMPSAIAAMLVDETKRAVMNGESLDDLIARLLDMGLSPPPGPLPKPRRIGRRK